MGGLDFHSAARIRLLGEEATRIGCEEILENFAPNVLLCVMGEQGENADLGRTLNALQRCVKARDDLHELEREMDKDYFVQLVTGGYLERSGIDRETEHIATWVRCGAFFKSTWQIRMGSPKAKSLVRAFIWMLETKLVQNDFEPKTRSPTYYNFAMGLMEFNPALLRAVTVMLKDILPISNHVLLYTFGLHQAVPVVWNIIMRAYPRATSRMRLFESFSDAVDMVTDATDIPDFWFSDEFDVDKYRYKRTNTWCFERCLSDENRVTTKDLYNPGPWPYAPGENVDVNSLSLFAKQTRNGGGTSGDTTDTNSMDGLHDWFSGRKENVASASRKPKIGVLALDAIHEDDSESEDL